MMRINKSHQAYNNSHTSSHTQQVASEPRKKFEIAGTEFVVDAKYEIMKQIGSGAYGVVVSAVDRTTNKKYAIKKVTLSSK